jgi:hypothetical protein
MSGPSYSKHQETLIAAATHLAMGQYVSRQAKNLAKDLSIEPDEVAIVLVSFKGLFRQSGGTSEKYYCLQLRFSRQNIDDEESLRPPLETQYLLTLLDFISRKASEESQRSTAMLVALITAGLSLIASLVALAVTLLRA